MKAAPGGLRDLAAVRAIAQLTDPALLRQGPSDSARLDEAEEFLLRIRSILHLDSRRNQNVLSHAMQEKAAGILAYPGTMPQTRAMPGLERKTDPQTIQQGMHGKTARAQKTAAWIWAAAGTATAVFPVPPGTLRMLSNATVDPITEARQPAAAHAGDLPSGGPSGGASIQSAGA